MTISNEASDGPGSIEVEPDGFEAFFVQVERRLTISLVARYGAAVGREAAADSLAWAWEHWPRVSEMTNPAGYLYRVGQTSARRQRRHILTRFSAPDPAESNPADEDPRLEGAMAKLSTRQRQVTMLVHGYGFTHREVGDLLGIASSSVQNHAERGITKLRKCLETNE